MEMAPPRNTKEVQCLNGKVAALNWFISRATDKCLPFFHMLKKSFEWIAECQQAFDDLKAYLSSPQLLSPSQPREELFLYLTVSLAVVSVALVREEDRVQKLVYYTSRALRDIEERYPLMEKLTFALDTAAHKLKLYFQANIVVVLTNKPLRRAMSNPEVARQMALWAIELSEFDVQCCPRTTIKGHVGADFIAEFTHKEDQGVEEHIQWSIHTDGSSNRQASGASIVLRSPKREEIECMVRLNFPTTNNEAEYEALVAGLDLAKAAGATSVVMYCDSLVVTSQVNDDYECKGERMKKYLEQVRKWMGKFQAKFVQIPKEENEQVDHLAKAALAEHMLTPSKILSFVQLFPLMDGVGVQGIDLGSNWTTPIVSYLKDDTLPDDK